MFFAICVACCILFVIFYGFHLCCDLSLWYVIFAFWVVVCCVCPPYMACSWLVCYRWKTSYFPCFCDWTDCARCILLWHVGWQLVMFIVSDLPDTMLWCMILLANGYGVRQCLWYYFIFYMPFLCWLCDIFWCSGIYYWLYYYGSLFYDVTISYPLMDFWVEYDPLAFSSSGDQNFCSLLFRFGIVNPMLWYIWCCLRIVIYHLVFVVIWPAKNMFFLFCMSCTLLLMALCIYICAFGDGWMLYMVAVYALPFGVTSPLCLRCQLLFQ